MGDEQQEADDAVFDDSLGVVSHEWKEVDGNIVLFVEHKDYGLSRNHKQIGTFDLWHLKDLCVKEMEEGIRWQMRDDDYKKRGIFLKDSFGKPMGGAIRGQLSRIRV